MGCGGACACVDVRQHTRAPLQRAPPSADIHPLARGCLGSRVSGTHSPQHVRMRAHAESKSCKHGPSQPDRLQRGNTEAWL